ncbi:hypothetical protein EVAR_24737_1 [Eumeta japonica]|uniref:Uncharacterized protein n=1 Tax=Eumeta variegata TaxID=151549 RepID=A0A4C1VFJ7_EUMVA|nr:hypothetical protein EVAR_24737_1 [Eumeta japonica]
MNFEYKSILFALTRSRMNRPPMIHGRRNESLIYTLLWRLYGLIHGSLSAAERRPAISPAICIPHDIWARLEARGANVGVARTHPSSGRAARPRRRPRRPNCAPD